MILRLIVFLVCAPFILVAQNDQAELSVGDFAPSFSGQNQYGDSISLTTLLEDRAVVLVFYRGGWCPYCRKHVSNLNDSLQLLEEHGGRVVLITPEKLNNQTKIRQISNDEIMVVHDSSGQIMRAYGTNFQISKQTVPRFYNYVSNNAVEHNGGSETLPVPATFVIGMNGKIKFVHYDPDYRNRSSIKKILEVL